jgi:hypothetical protein
MCDQNFAQILFSIYTRILQVMYLNRSKLKSKVKHVLSRKHHVSGQNVD